MELFPAGEGQGSRVGNVITSNWSRNGQGWWRSHHKQLVQVKDTGGKANRSNRCNREQSSKATGAKRDTGGTREAKSSNWWREGLGLWRSHKKQQVQERQSHQKQLVQVMDTGGKANWSNRCRRAKSSESADTKDSRECRGFTKSPEATGAGEGIDSAFIN